MHELLSQANLKLHRLIEDQTFYASEEQKVTLEEVNAFNQSYVEGQGAPDQFAAFKERLKELMLIDSTLSASLGNADQVYGKLNNEARAERKILQQQAEASGIEKAKKDLFGTKKRAARKKLDRIQKSKAKLDAHRAEEESQYRTRKGIFLASPEWVDFTIKTNADFKPIVDKVAAIRKKPLGEWTTRESQFVKAVDRAGTSPVGKFQAIEDDSLYAQRINATTDEFYGSDTLGKKFQKDSLYRDTARWSSPLGQADKVTAQQMRVKANQTYVMIYGKTIDGEEKSEADQLAALRDLRSSVILMKQEMESFVARSPVVFSGEAGPMELIREFPMISEIYKKSQPITNLTKAMITSPAFKLLPQDEQKQILELRRYTSAVSKYTAELVNQARKWGDYSDREKQPTLKGDQLPSPIDPLDKCLETATTAL
ncbi:MAG: hypothetical protein IK115_01300 [Lachnospiraceae bacterium]|nr:hypothetical protein [Lachnospiraceae bacterium]